MTLKEPGKSAPFAQLLCQLARTFREANISYMVFGGQAVLMHGEPRFTQDIDITIGLSPAEASPVLEVITKLGLEILVDKAEEFLRETFVLPVRDPASGIRVDIVFSLSDFERDSIRRAIPVSIYGEPINFVCVEDLLILKTIAGRPRDLEDIRGILAKNPSYDSRHVVNWLKAYDQELDGGYENRFLEIAKQSR